MENDPIRRPGPEVLAPAGDWPALEAAIACGADAIDFGLPRNNARFRATNFSLTDLPRIMERLHRHGFRGYVTFNTLTRGTLAHV